MTVTTEEAELLAATLEGNAPAPGAAPTGYTIAAALRSLAAERDALKAAINESLTEELPIEGGTWSQEPIGPNETPGEAIRRLIKHRVKTGRDALQAGNARLREALESAGVLLEWWHGNPAGVPYSSLMKDYKKKRDAALGEKE